MNVANLKLFPDFLSPVALRMISGSNASSYFINSRLVILVNLCKKKKERNINKNNSLEIKNREKQ